MMYGKSLEHTLDMGLIIMQFFFLHAVIQIPHEIEKLGNEAVAIYRKALSEGMEQIPYCSLLLLGREEVGKTSLFRQLLRKPFDPNLERTRGIDNKTVDTVQKRDVDTAQENWLAKEDFDTNEQFSDAIAACCINKLPKRMSEYVQKHIPEADLLSQMKAFSATDSSEHVATTAPVSARLSDITKDVIPKENPAPESAKIPKRSIEDDITTEKKPSQVAPVSSEVRILTDGVLNYRQSSNLDKLVLCKQPYEKKQPSLVFNIKDFAGQPEYRPMHHCYISERGLFLVMFKLTDMLQFIENKGNCERNPLDEISYWTRSIHAHISSRPWKEKEQEQEKEKKGKLKQVLLVGTRRDGLLPNIEEGLKKINDFIEKELILNKNERCIDHIYFTGSNYFVAVENSIDFQSNGESYLKESGTSLIQDTVKAMSQTLPYLNDVYPIMWLKFKDDLKQQGRLRKLAPVMKMEEVKKLACIPENQLDTALEFFHITGKIICLSKYALRYGTCMQNFFCCRIEHYIHTYTYIHTYVRTYLPACLPAYTYIHIQ